MPLLDHPKFDRMNKVASTLAFIGWKTKVVPGIDWALENIFLWFDAVCRMSKDKPDFYNYIQERKLEEGLTIMTGLVEIVLGEKEGREVLNLLQAMDTTANAAEMREFACAGRRRSAKMREALDSYVTLIGEQFDTLGLDEEQQRLFAAPLTRISVLEI